MCERGWTVNDIAIADGVHCMDLRFGLLLPLLLCPVHAAAEVPRRVPSERVKCQPCKEDLSPFVAASQLALLNTQDVQLDVIVQTCTSLADFLRSRTSIERSSETGTITASVCAFLEPEDWQEAEHVSSGGTPLSFVRDQVPAATATASDDDALLAALNGAPVLAMKLIRREAVEELAASADAATQAENSMSGGDCDAARRVHELSMAWARDGLTAGTRAPPPLCCEADRVLDVQDATTRFVQARPTFRLADGGVRVRAPSLATPISGPRALGAGCTFCKVVPPGTIMGALLSLRGGCGRRSMLACAAAFWPLLVSAAAARAVTPPVGASRGQLSELSYALERAALLVDRAACAETRQVLRSPVIRDFVGFGGGGHGGGPGGESGSGMRALPEPRAVNPLLATIAAPRRAKAEAELLALWSDLSSIEEACLGTGGRREADMDLASDRLEDARNRVRQLIALYYGPETCIGSPCNGLVGVAGYGAAAAGMIKN